jgi:hypothetical protein
MKIEVTQVRIYSAVYLARTSSSAQAFTVSRGGVLRIA